MSVVVTGWGVCASALPSLDELLTAPTGAGIPDEADSSPGLLAVRRADEADASRWIPRRHARKMDRASRITAAAVGAALQRAGLTDEQLVRETGLVLTTAFGSAGVVSRVLEDVLSDDPVISPLVFPNVVANAAAGHASICFGMRGPNSVLGGVGGLMYAYDLLVSRRAERLVVGGFDEITAVYEHALREAGFPDVVDALGEGAAVIVLETGASARARGATPLAELQSVSAAADLDFALDGALAYAGDGMTRAIERVLRDEPAPDLLLGSGWPGTELRRIEQRHADGAPAGIWPKSRTGEMFSCSAALNTVLATHALQRGRVSTVLVTGHDSVRGQSEAARFRCATTDETPRSGR